MPAKAQTIDEYVALWSEDKRACLEKLRRDIQAAAPEAEGCIAYGIPGFRLDGKLLISFGAAEKHCALYPGTVMDPFRKELARYDTSGRGTIRFPPDRPPPATLVRKLVKASTARIRRPRTAARPVAGRARRKP